MTFSPTTMSVLGWGIRICVLLAYLTWVLKGLCMLQDSKVNLSELQYVALRELPVGHRLNDKDFRFDPPIPLGERNRLPAGIDLVGKYLLTEQCAGHKIAQSDVSSAPVVHVGKNMVEYWFPLERQGDLVNVLDSDSRVDVCAGYCVLQNLRVLSIMCSSTTPMECFAALELSPDDSKKFSGDIKNYRLIRR
jgi:hypothetical protein